MTAATFQSMLGIFWNETYGAMTNYNVGDDGRDNGGDNDGNQDRSDANNAASGSVSDVPMFQPIKMPHHYRGVLGDYGDGSAAHHVSMRRTI